MKYSPHISDLIDTLQLRCPTVFPSKPLPKVPIAFHQHKAIQRILDVNYATADYILLLWCHGRRYDLACAKEGAQRIRCDGVARGAVSRSEAAYHKKRLDAYYERRAVGETKKCEGSISDYYAAKFPKEPNTPGTISEFLSKLWALRCSWSKPVNTKEETA